MAKLTMIEGVGEVYAEKLKAAGVTTTESLLEMGATPKGRKDLAEATGLSPHLILKWINRVDLFRIKGVGEEYADLLELAGVDTVPELAQRNPENLCAKLISHKLSLSAHVKSQLRYNRPYEQSRYPNQEK